MADFLAKNIIKDFDTPEGPLRILDGVSVELDRGQSMAIVGPSGSGKSTFLHIAGTLDRASSGELSLQGVDPNGFSNPQLAQFRNEQIGFVFQEHYLLPQLSALENVLVPAVARGAVPGELRERAEELLAQVDLAERRDHRPAALSGGERQRVAVARALLMQPVLLLADEPTGSLDQKNAERVGQLLLDLQKTGDQILICVTHSDRLARKFEVQVSLENGQFLPRGSE
ncbi:MAG: ABC transporter ATP-binding protein [Mariniblastus sp.]|nr:ABC transporter ATP-binding protein [Mariniblastus sp.]